ncbi:hypothetical protein RB195_008312 [Necator americanus]|uniref:BTB domain-containing protein n=2 Tax=Necator americanus TaxID=51031 RepID=A0ABR1CN23_NECAM
MLSDAQVDSTDSGMDEETKVKEAPHQDPNCSIDHENASGVPVMADVSEEKQRDESVDSQAVIDERERLIKDDEQDQVASWIATIAGGTQFFIDFICYGALDFYSLILLQFLRICGIIYHCYNCENAIHECQEVLQGQNSTNEDSHPAETEENIESPSGVIINVFDTLSMICFSLDELDDGNRCINHEKFLYKEAFSSLERLRCDGMLCDVELSVGDHRSISAHKIVLAAVIPYFRAMFTTEMLEQNKRKIIVQNLDFEILELFVVYAYSGRLHITTQNVLEVMVAANFFQLDNITDNCGTYLQRRLHPSNVLSVHALCSVLNCRSLVYVTERFIAKYFTLVCRCEQFLQLSIDSVTEILCMDDLYVETEGRVFEAALAWIEHDSNHRSIFISRILDCIRLKALAPSFLVTQVAGHELIRNDSNCKQLVEEAKDYFLIKTEDSSISPGDVQPRVCHDPPCLILAVGGESEGDFICSEIEKYNPITRQWVPLLPMLSGRTEVGVAVHDGKIYVVGGRVEGSSGRVECFDWNFNTWAELARMRTPRRLHSVAFLNNELYACGGIYGNNSLHSVEVFSPVENKWKACAEMSTQRCGAAAAVLDGCLYMIGGSKRTGEGTSPLSTVERYSPSEGKWVTVASMKSQRMFCAAAALNGRIYVCGGSNIYETLNTVECYDPKKNVWVSVAPMKVGRYAFSVVACDNAIYAIAGRNSSTVLCSTEIYNEDTNEWEFDANLTRGRAHFGAAVVPVSPGSLSV